MSRSWVDAGAIAAEAQEELGGLGGRDDLDEQAICAPGKRGIELTGHRPKGTCRVALHG